MKVLETIYGCDIIEENIVECKLRLLKIIKNKLNILEDAKIKEAIKIINKNIVHVPLNKYKNGSLDYLELDETLIFNNNDECENIKIFNLFKEFLND